MDAQVDILKSLKIELDELKKSFADVIKARQALRDGLDQLLTRKFFFVPSFEIYSGVAGLYDYGPTGCAVMANLQQLWRQWFVLTDNMLEVSCSTLTPEPVLKSSGHVDRFTDFLVHDSVTNDPFRADKIVEDWLENLMGTDPNNATYQKEFNAAGSMNGTELDNIIKKYNITNNGHPFTPAVAFNLMFQTTIGPSSRQVSYLRPETAQGIFVNFKRLYEYNNHKLPFAAAQIGLAYRNEIAPRGGLLRVREFCMAEIEHFVHPERKQHPRFHTIANIEATFWSADNQVNGVEAQRTTFGQAVGSKMVDNETLGYFLARTYLFLTMIGVLPGKLRFRQHRKNEMAHYATDCWDAEIHTTSGWIECVGHADRSAYDLKVHAAATKSDLSVQEVLETPRIERKLVVKPNRGAIGQKFRTHAKDLFPFLLNGMTQDELKIKQSELDDNGKITIVLPQYPEQLFELLKTDLEIVQIDEKTSVDVYTPHVIEPSFGLGRIIYCLLEHSYYVRENDSQRNVLRLPPCIAPVKVALYNVIGNIPYQPILDGLRQECIELSLSFNEDISKNSIGRKYSRGDEIGTPYAISIDNESTDVNKKLVTIRERDSCTQVQVKLQDAVEIVFKLVKGKYTWEHVYNNYPRYTNVNEDAE